MTDITRIFNVDSRAFTDVVRQYAGQVNDSLSTVLHFEYNPISFPIEEGYTPYIMFDVHDSKGHPLIYGPDSTPKFDGYTFPIPWDVTSRVTTKRLEYQLFFVRNDVEYDPETGVPQLNGTEYLESVRDGIALKSSIQCKTRNPCCPPMAPTTQPDVVGYINLFKEYGVVVPIEQTYDETTQKLTLIFHTYNGTQDCRVELNVPALVDGKIPHGQLDITTDLGDVGELETYSMASAKAVVDWLTEYYTPKTMSVPLWDETAQYSESSTVIYDGVIFVSLQDENVGHQPKTDGTPDEWWVIASSVDVTEYIVTEWSAEPSDLMVPSEKLTKDTFDTKLDKDQLITAWGEPTDSQIPSANLVKTELDDKLDDSQLVTAWSVTPSDNRIASEKLVANALVEKLDDSQLVDSWSTEPSSDKIPSERLVKDELDAKLDDDQLVTSWTLTPSDDNIPSEKLVKTELDDKLDDSQLVTEWSAIPSDAKIPSESLVKDELDGKLDDSQLEQTISSENSKIPSSYAVSLALSNKTDKVMAIGQWQAGLTYSVDSTVVSSGVIYISLVNDNIGHNPLDDTENQYWTQIQGGGGGSTNVDYRTIQFGNNYQTVYDLPNALNTYDFIWSLRETSAPREYVIARVQAIDKSTIRVILSEPPGDNALTMNIMTLRTSTHDVTVEEVEILTPSTVWEYSNDSGQVVFVQTFDQTGDQIQGNIEQPSVSDFSPVSISFGEDQMGSMIVAKSDLVERFDNLYAWMIPHNLNTFVGVQTYDDSGNQIFGDIKQNGNVVVIEFDTPQSGYAVLIPATTVVQFTNQTEWTLQHGLGRYVCVQTYDEQYDQVYGNVEQTENSVTVTFAEPQSGYMMII